MQFSVDRQLTIKDQIYDDIDSRSNVNVANQLTRGWCSRLVMTNYLASKVTSRCFDFLRERDIASGQSDR